MKLIILAVIIVLSSSLGACATTGPKSGPSPQYLTYEAACLEQGGIIYCTQRGGPKDCKCVARDSLNGLFPDLRRY